MNSCSLAASKRHEGGSSSSASSSSRSLVAQSIDIASLAAFRILFGLLMCAAMIRFLAKGWVREFYVLPVFHFTYPGFSWLRPWPDFWMHAHFIVLALLALGISLGFLYRFCALLFFLGFTYVELLDQTAYLNHYYFISLLSFLLILLPANRAWSLDAHFRPHIRQNVAPAWCLNILRFQVAVVYVFAGLAKFNADWLFHAQPLRIWLSARSDLPLIGPWLEQPWVAYAASWFGAIFDVSIVCFLLPRRTRRPAYLILIAFHVATWILFHIGMFPWIMIVAATILFPADWPRYWMKCLGLAHQRLHLRLPFRVLHPTQRFNTTNREAINSRRATKWWRAWEANSTVQQPVYCFSASPARSILTHASLCLYVVVQLALPVRPYLPGQPAAWTCSGFNCAWQVMIVEKTGYTEFFAVDPQTRHRRKLHLEDLLTPRQKIMMDQDPYLIRDLARRLPTLLHQPQLEIHVDAFASLNGRPSQRIIQPGLNLMGALPNDWIMPLRACSAGEQLSLLSQRYPAPFQPGDPATSEAPMQSSADH